MKTIFEQIEECPHNMCDILELRQPVADYLACIIDLYSMRLIEQDHADKIMKQVEDRYRSRIAGIRNSLLN